MFIFLAIVMVMVVLKGTVKVSRQYQAMKTLGGCRAVAYVVLSSQHTEV